MNSARMIRFDDIPGLEIMQAAYETHAFLPHFHACFAISMVHKGAESFTYGHTTYVAKAGDLVAMNPYVVHTGEPFDMTDGYHYKIIYFSKETLVHLGLSDKLFSFKQTLHAQSIHYHAVFEFHKLIERGAETSEIEQALLVMLLALQGPTENETMTVEKTWSLDHMNDLIDEQLSVFPTLDEMAEEAGLSKFHFIRSFKSDTGLTPLQYVHNRKMAIAKRYLEEGARIIDIAHLLGYSDQSHFTRRFKLTFGVKPSQV